MLWAMLCSVPHTASTGQRLLTNESTGKQGEADSQGANIAMARLCDSHSIHSGHQDKGHDELPQEELTLSNGDSSLMCETAWHAVPTPNSHPGDQHSLQGFGTINACAIVGCSFQVQIAAVLSTAYDVCKGESLPASCF